ncbi:MAG TPA: DNA polymerase I [Candidatus Paceibacterota bacterium]|nr:DNA polymerase I [Verrucomicrobiota bacterium]HSA08867.1 DNA polymerase I [Candidatus Paceibacterota bacterium]
MVKKLFLLDGMALAYRAHFAFIHRPILTSKGVNTSALYGFTQTLLDILQNQQPTHLGVAFDTAAPTQRHAEFADYKANREEMPEELSAALPHVRRMVEALNVPVLICDGYEADDIIGTLVRRAGQEGFQSYMVTSDKDFGQLVTAGTFIFKPSRSGEGAEVLGPPEIQARWGVQCPEQLVDVLALMGDASDNIPGVPGIGEKTAMKLIGQYGTLDNLLSHAGELTGRLKQTLETNREQALLSKRLATIICDAPCGVELDALKVQPPNEEKLKSLLVEFEFNSIGRRLFGEDFKAGRGGGLPKEEGTTQKPSAAAAGGTMGEQLVLVSETEGVAEEPIAEPAATSANLKTIAEVPHEYHLAATPADRARLIKTLQKLDSFCFDTETTSLDPKAARLVGLAFSFKPHTGYYVPVPQDAAGARRLLEEFRPVLESDAIEKAGHNLKFDISVLRWQGVSVGGKLFDTMIAHSLIEPEMRHGMDYLSEVYLAYTPIPITKLIGDPKAGQVNMADVPAAKAAEYSAEDADVTWQLRAVLEPLLKQKGQERVFYEVESPLIPVLVDMEFEGIKVDAAALAEFAAQLSKEMDEAEKTIYRLAGTTFNLNSPRQLGQVLFDLLKLGNAPKKTRTGQYATDEQTLTALAADHEIVQRLLEYRAASKLKSTYADALPEAIWPRTGRVHTTYNQVMTSTGRLNSQNPNLQNIPIRTERGQEIRKAFVPRGPRYRLLSADYSQIELRILAALSHEAAMLEAFEAGADIHAATAARVFGVPSDAVEPEMRRKAKMVNFGIAYGMSAFGLSQRLGIPRAEAGEIIDQYFRQFPGIRRYMDETIEFARKKGYVETVTGRRRYLRDIRSANNTIRGAAERNAINAPIQGTAADMIKLAMINLHRELARRNLKTRMLLQVHDELVFDLYLPEEQEVLPLVEEKMKTAIQLDVPMAVEMGTGGNWLEAH